MRRYLLLLCMLGLWFSSSAQEHQRWTIGLSGIHGTLDNASDYNKVQGFAFSPSLRYNFTSDWSVGAALLLPIASHQINWKAMPYTTGIEVLLRKDFRIIPRLRLSLSAISFWGTTEQYKSASISSDSVLTEDGKYKTRPQASRWQIGLRPSVSYQVTQHWAVDLGYGFWGYRSSRIIDRTHTPEERAHERSTWGFNGEMGWGNALRLGINYTF